jgi:hypothetical protein
MTWLWYVGQAGIAVELFGAAIGVWFALETRQRWRNLNPNTYDGLGDGLQAMKEEFAAQYPKQLGAFGLIGLGLVFQFIGNFANR